MMWVHYTAPPIMFTKYLFCVHMDNLILPLVYSRPMFSTIMEGDMWSQLNQACVGMCIPQTEADGHLFIGNM